MSTSKTSNSSRFSLRTHSVTDCHQLHHWGESIIGVKIHARRRAYIVRNEDVIKKFNATEFEVNVPGITFVFGKNDAPTGAAAATSDDGVKGKGSSEEAHVPVSEALEEVEAGDKAGGQNKRKEKGTPQKPGQQQFQQFKSPTKAAAACSPGNGVGHGHRHHFCRSPRCASNNPDYATPVQVPPRKYLISKRHLVPGAICTRDPSSLPICQIPLPPPLSGGKPPPRPSPSSVCKHPTTNTFRQLSFKDASPDTSKSFVPHQAPSFTSPDTDCEGTPAETVCCVTGEGSAPSEPALLRNDEVDTQEQNNIVSALETRLQDYNDIDLPLLDLSSLRLQEQRSLDGIDPEKDESFGVDCKHGGPSDDEAEDELLQSADGIDHKAAVNHALNSGEGNPCDDVQAAEQLQSPEEYPQAAGNDGLNSGEGDSCYDAQEAEQLQSPDGIDSEVTGNDGLKSRDEDSSDQVHEAELLQIPDGIFSEAAGSDGLNSVDGISCDEVQEAEQLEAPDGIDSEAAVKHESNSGEGVPCAEVQEVEQLTRDYQCFSPETDFESSKDAGCKNSCDAVEVVRCETFPAASSNASASAASPVSRSSSEEERVPVACSLLADGQGSDEVLSSPAEVLHSADELPPDVDDVAKALEQRLVLDEMENTNPPSGRPSCDDGIVDIYDLDAAASTSSSEKEAAAIKEDYILRYCPAKESIPAESDECSEAEVTVVPKSRDGSDEKDSNVLQEEEKSEIVEKTSVTELFSHEPESSNCKSAEEPMVQRAPPRFGSSKGRLLWRSDCRNSRELVTLKPTNYDRHQGDLKLDNRELVTLKPTNYDRHQGDWKLDNRELVTLKPTNCDRYQGDWKLDSLLEGATNQLQPSGEGRVRRLVKAFESLMNISEPEPEKRLSRVWCLNRRGKAKVDGDGDVCENRDQRVDFYEMSEDRLELRASLRLSIGGISRQEICCVEDEEEISSMQKVQDWDDLQACNSSDNGEDKDGGDQQVVKGSSSTDRAEAMANNHPYEQFRSNEKERKRVQMYNEVKQQLGYKTEDNVKIRIQRYNRPKSSKSSSVKSETESNLGSAEKRARAIRNTQLEPFRLLTEERGALKEYQFARKLEQLFAEEERLRNPIAQGLPWTTDEPEIVPKPPVKQPTRHIDFNHFSDSRAAMRAEFDNYMAQREMSIKMRKEEEEIQRQLADQEEIKRLRREMVPRAQLMPLFDQPFMPERSSKRLTIPKEPKFKTRQHKRAKCMVSQQGA
ncbi:hypothetical protein R1flu_007340 [Riccia fluitans]|uniref:TPX2 C-terminal domain-containing protein n=1 Tax=Riccia fluitans TaxID=41844 RepID=A0ABD1YYN6_9MARC